MSICSVKFIKYILIKTVRRNFAQCLAKKETQKETNVWCFISKEQTTSFENKRSNVYINKISAEYISADIQCDPNESIRIGSLRIEP